MSSEFHVTGPEQAESPQAAPRPDQVSCAHVSCSPAPESSEFSDAFESAASEPVWPCIPDATRDVAMPAGEEQPSADAPVTDEPDRVRSEEVADPWEGWDLAAPPAAGTSEEASWAKEERNGLAEPIWAPREVVRDRTPGRSGRALAPAEGTAGKRTFTPEQRLLLLDTWRRSGLSARDFAALTGLSKNTLHKWHQLFEAHGPAALMDQPKGGPSGTRLPDLTRRTILMLKQSHPEWGCHRISDLLVRGPALAASASAVAHVLHEAGYQSVRVPTHRHPDKVRRFERARPNQLWQTDLFTFTLKRQNRRLHLVAFLDDHSRFVVSYGLHASASTALVLEALEAGIASYGPPEEILTDNGPQYVTWRGKSQFSKHLEKRGIRQIVARPRRPQTLGKVERFWGTLWREFLETAVFLDLADARTRIGLFVDYYNFQRVHRGIDGLVPADRFFGAAQEVLQTLKQRVAANALELARHGQPRQPFYVTGQVDGQAFSVHAEGERLILRRADGQREEVTLHAPVESPTAASASLPQPLCPQGAPNVPPGEPALVPPPPPGTTAWDPADVPDVLSKEEEEEDDDHQEEGGVA